MQDSKLKVVVIDDEQCIRETFQWHLEDQGVEVVTSDCPLSCPVYEGHDCDQDDACGDVLFIDFNMKKMTGLEFLEKMALRGCKGARENKFLMSGNTTGIDRGRAEKIGATVLAKPVSLAELDSILSKVSARLTGV